MGFFIDLVLISIVLLNIFIGYKKGLISTIFSICAFFIAIVVTFILYNPVSDIIIENTGIVQKVESAITEKGKSNKEEIDEESKNSLEQYADEIKESAKEHSLEIASKMIAEKVVRIIIGIVLYIIIRIVLIIFKFLLEGVAELPIIKQFNHAGGLVLGIIKSVVMVYIILTVLFFVVSINQEGIIANSINDSIITKILYENNIIVKLLPFA